MSVVAPARPAPGVELTADDPGSAPRSEGLAARALPPVLLALGALVLWELAARARPGGELPSPLTVLAETVRLLVAGDLVRVVTRTVSTMLLAFVLSAVAGVAGGLALARRRLADRAVSPYLIGLQSLPSAVWIPVAVIFLGASPAAVLAVTVLGALPSIAIGTRDAVHGIPPILLRAASTLGAERRTMLLRVVVPAALPGIVSGLEHGWAFAFRSLVAGELIIGASGAGLGLFVAQSRDAGRVDRLFAAVLVIMVVGVVVDRLGFARVQRRLRRRRGLAGT